MVRPERVRVTMDAPTGDVAAVPATVTDLTFQGPVVRLGAGRRRRVTDRRARRSRRGPADAAARRPGVSSAGRRTRRWCCRPPTSPPPRISRRCWTTPDSPDRPDRPLPRMTKGRAAMASKHDQNRSGAVGPTRRQPRLPTAVPRRRRRRSGRAGARSLLPGRVRLRQRFRRRRHAGAANGPGRRRLTGIGKSAHLELAAVHGRRLRRRVPDCQRADGGLQGRLQRQRGMVRQEQGAAVA